MGAFPGPYLPQPTDILGEYGKAVALRTMLQQQQYQQQMQPLQLQQEQLQVQQLQLQQKSREAMLKAYTEDNTGTQGAGAGAQVTQTAGTQGAGAQATTTAFDPVKWGQRAMQLGADPGMVMPQVKEFQAQQVQAEDLRGKKLDNAQKVIDEKGRQAQMLLAIKDPVQRAQAYMQTTLPTMAGLGVTNLPPTVPDEPTLQTYAASAKNAGEWLKTAQQTQEHEQQHGIIDPQRYQVTQAALNNFAANNKDDPAKYQLPPQGQATWDDYNRIDKIMEHTEKNVSNLAQIQGNLEIRRQTFAIQMAAKQEAEELRMITPVIGYDDQGNPVLTSAAGARDMNLRSPMKAEQADVSKAMSARQWVRELATPTTADPHANPMQAGIGQLIDDLDKRGQLDFIARHWNDFMAGTIGARDPEVQALHTKLQLSGSLLAQAHAGKVGSAMMEHFQDLANDEKMNGPMLKAGFGSELNYVQQRQMLPSTPLGATGPTFQQGTQVGQKRQTTQPSAAGGGNVTVQIPGQPPGQIPRSQLQGFKRKYPNATVSQ